MDYLEQCITDTGQAKDYKAFQEVFCLHCRNPSCIHAKWAVDKFSARVAIQPTRFFHSPQADPDDPKYNMLQDFPLMLREAMTLEISDRMQDWNIPEIPILDGKEIVAPLATTQAVDDAVKALSSAQDKQTDAQPAVEPVAQPEPEKQVITEPVKEVPVTSQVKEQKTVYVNTPVPSQGIMIDGSEPEKKPAKPVVDPWAPVGKDVFVNPGAKVKLGK